MEQLTTFEYVETYFLASAATDAQFQFWLTVTFAVIAASFVAGDRLSRRLRLIVSGLYLLACFIVMSRSVIYGTTLVGAVERLHSAGMADLVPMLGVWAYARPFLYLVGTSVALWFLLVKRRD